MKTGYVATLFLIAWGLATAMPPPSFYASFDGTLDATTTDGVTAASDALSADFAFVEGLKGQAVRLRGKSGIAYALAKNVDARQGTVSFWYKPEWNAENARKWRFLFAFAAPEEERFARIGSGLIRVWSYDGNPRADPSDALDGYLTFPPFCPGVWHHVAYVWSATNQAFFVNGRKRNTILNCDLNKSARLFDAFWIGGQKNGCAADGLIDEFRLYTHPLSDAEVHSLQAEFDALAIEILTPYVLAGENASVVSRILNRSNRRLSAQWQVNDLRGEIDLPAHHDAEVKPNLNVAPGKITIRADSPDMFEKTATAWAMSRDNPWTAPTDNTLEMELLDTVLLQETTPAADRFVSTGAHTFRENLGMRYLEAGGRRGDRFAVRFRLPPSGTLFCFEIDYPDDADRIADIIVQPSDARSPASPHHCESDCHSYQLQVGYVTGDKEYHHQHKILTSRRLYWSEPDKRDVSMVFSTLRDRMPAAVAAVRLYKVNDGLPEAGVIRPEAVDGWGRTVALYYEDPAMAYDFGIAGSKMPDFEELINRVAAYMKYSGQNLLVYPAVWYSGLIGPTYQPRPKTTHAENHLSGWFTKFDAEGLGFMPGINLYTAQNLTLPGTLQNTGATNGMLHATCVMALANGGFQLKMSHHASPKANLLHPDTRAAILEYVDRLIEIGKAHPSFKGLDVRLSSHCMLWLGDIQAGYNDYAIDGFMRDTEITVPADRNDPARGKVYAEWLLSHAREEWLDWRCRQVAAFHKEIAARLAAARGDLRFCLTLFPPVWRPQAAELFSDPNSTARLNREAGIDPALYADTPNIVISQGARTMQVRRAMARPADQPLGDDAFSSRDIFYTPEYYAALSQAHLPWIHTHDYYWETSFGDPLREGKRVPALESEWFREHHWRVTTMNPPAYHALKQYVLPLRYHDILGMTRGGFLIGTYGTEEFLVPFARAFRALPARLFRDMPQSTGTVKYRSLDDGEKTWFYVVNTADTPASFKVDTNGEAVTDLLTGACPAELAAGTLDLVLEPYQLRSFYAHKNSKRQTNKKGRND